MQESTLELEPMRDGQYVVVRDGTTLPRRCAFCNQVAIGGPVKLSFDDGRGPGLVGAAVAEAVNVAKGSRYTGPVVASFHLCGEHRTAAWYVWVGLFVTLLLAAGGAFYVNTALRGDSRTIGLLACGGVAIGLVAIMVGLMLGIVKIRSFAARKFNDRFVWLEGSNEAFLNSLVRFDPSRITS